MKKVKENIKEAVKQAVKETTQENKVEVPLFTSIDDLNKYLYKTYLDFTKGTLPIKELNARISLVKVQHHFYKTAYEQRKSLGIKEKIEWLDPKEYKNYI